MILYLENRCLYKKLILAYTDKKFFKNCIFILNII